VCCYDRKRTDSWGLNLTQPFTFRAARRDNRRLFSYRAEFRPRHSAASKGEKPRKAPVETACSKSVTAPANDIVSKPELAFDQSLWPPNPVVSLNKHGHRHGSFIAVLVAAGAAIVKACEWHQDVLPSASMGI
jgi:hypothetical protein